MVNDFAQVPTFLQIDHEHYNGAHGKSMYRESTAYQNQNVHNDTNDSKTGYYTGENFHQGNNTNNGYSTSHYEHFDELNRTGGSNHPNNNWNNSSVRFPETRNEQTTNQLPPAFDSYNQSNFDQMKRSNQSQLIQQSVHYDINESGFNRQENPRMGNPQLPSGGYMNNSK